MNREKIAHPEAYSSHSAGGIDFNGSANIRQKGQSILAGAASVSVIDITTAIA
jgi:hypothetical protein